MISDFEAGVKCLQNPSLISRFFSISKVPQVYSFWKWGALILAIVATFSSLIRKLKILFIYVTTLKPSAEPLLQYLGEDFDISDDDEDDDDDQCSSVMSSDDDDEDVNDRKIDQDFTSSFYCKGQGQGQGQNRHLSLRKRRTNNYEWFPWTEGKNVVKLWDSLALGLDFDLDYEFDDSIKNIVSLWDLNKEKKISNISGGNCKSPAVAVASPTVVLSNDGVFTGYDMRMKSQTPAICAKWGHGEVVGVNTDGVGKVYVSNEGCLTVGDLRNVKTPLENLTAGDADTWWDADAVIIEDENFDG